MTTLRRLHSRLLHLALRVMPCIFVFHLACFTACTVIYRTTGHAAMPLPLISGLGMVASLWCVFIQPNRGESS
ncbi:hypothetical protein ACGFNU_00990 [Spirillospora sp. NPDC048911]|uniref:hypothetical protein n=1 Tax=Spirillospora sp. NPDC048911 TaxID=3364527 RepID=UPI00370FAFAA